MLKRLKRSLLGNHHHQSVSGSFAPARWWKGLWRRQWLRRRINYLLIIILVVGLSLFGVGVHFLHAYQVRRNAGVFLDQVERARQDKKPEQVERYLRFYLNLFPDHADSQFEYGKLLEERARSGKGPPRLMQDAYFALDRAVQLDPGRQEARRLLAKVAMDLGRFQDAEQQLHDLLEAGPPDPELMVQAALCAQALGQDDKAVRRLDDVIRTVPTHTEAYVLLAGLYRHRLKKPDLADDTMADLVRNNDKDARAYLARARHHREQEGKLGEVEADLARARELDGDNPDVLAAAADLAQARGRLDEARDLLRRGLKLHPKSVGLHRGLAVVEMRGGSVPRAIEVLEQGLKEVPDSDDLRFMLGVALVEAERFAEAEKTIDRLREARIPPPWVRYLEARVLAKRGQWLDAVQGLERVRPMLPELASDIDLLLCNCYQQIGDPRRRREVAQRLASADRASVQAQMELASALMADGQSEEATRRALFAADRSPGAKVLAAKMLGARLMELPPDRRDWEPVEKLLVQAAQEAPRSPDAPIVHAQVLMMQEDRKDAKKEALALLEAARERMPGRVEVPFALAWLLNRTEGPEAALAALAKAGDQPEVRLVRAGYLVQRQPAEARQQLAALERDLDKLPAAEQLRLLAGLAATHERLNDQADVERLWKRLAERQPHNLQVRLALFDRACRAGDLAGAERLAAEIRGIDGPKGAYTHQAAAALQLVLARRAEAPGEARNKLLAKAKEHLDAVDRLRPNTPAVLVLHAELKELEKDPIAAGDLFRQAVERGERRLDVIARAVRLLYARGRYDEANRLVQQMETKTQLTGDLGRMVAELSLRAPDRDRTLELVRQAVSQNSNDYRQLLWLGQMLAALGHKPEAEASLVRAAELAPAAPETCVVLVLYYADVNQRAKAEAHLEKVGAKLPPLDRAACLEVVGKADEAAKEYTAALQDKPNDFLVLRRASLFHLRRSELPQAETLLRKIGDMGDRVEGPDRTWARQQLALVLALTGDQAKFEEALALLGKVAAGGGTSVEDQRLRAIVLSTRPAERRRAIEQLKELNARSPSPLTSEELFRLAALHEAVGEWDEARKLLEGLIKAHAQNPRYLAHYLHGLLRHGGEAEAAGRLPDLEKLDPTGFPTLSVKARLAAAQKRGPEAVALVGKYVEDKAPAVLSFAGALLDDLKEDAAAEEMYRRLAAKSDRPEGELVLIQFLARHGKLPEALERLEKAWDKVPPEAAASTSVAVVRNGKARPEQCRPMEARLLKAAEKGATLALWISLADLFEYQGKYDAAMKIYREVLARNKNHVVALNNLGWLVALKDGKPDEGLAYVEAALKAVGPVPELLDTRGVIQLSRGQTDQAVDDLRSVVALAPTATRYFHLAQAYESNRNLPGARDALKKAVELGLQADTLHPLERDHYQRLRDQLK